MNLKPKYFIKNYKIMATYRVQRLYSNVYQKEFGAFSKFLKKTKSSLRKLNPLAKAKDAKKLAEERASSAFRAQQQAEKKAAFAEKSRDHWKKVAIGTGIGGTGLGLGVGLGGGYLLGRKENK